MSQHQTRQRIDVGWYEDNVRVQEARKPFIRRARKVLQIGGLSGFPGMLSEQRMKANIDTRGYFTYPLLFYTAFPDVSLAQLRTLSLTGSYLFDYILGLDSILDNPAGAHAGTIFQNSLLQQEALSLLHTLFPAGTPFWRYFEDYFGHFIQATLQERARHHGLLTPYGEEDLQFIYAGKPAVGKACIAALALLGDREALIAPMTASHDAFHVGYQLIDDLQDWRIDYLRRQYSYPLVHAFLEAGWKERIESDAPPHLDEVARLLLESGAVEQTRSLVLAYFDKALSLLAVDMADGSWAAAIEQTRRIVETFEFDAEPPPIRSVSPTQTTETSVIEWAVDLDAERTATPIAACWLPWLDHARVPHVGKADIRSVQYTSLCQAGRAVTLGEALCHVGGAITDSWQRYPAHSLAVHLGISTGELAWCRRNGQWADGLLALSLDEQACLWTPNSAPSRYGWVPPGLTRYLGYRLVTDYASVTAAPEEAVPAEVLHHYRQQLIA